MKKALITGITGQDGSLLLRFLLSSGYEVHGIKRRSSSFNTSRIDDLYETGNSFSSNFKIHFGDILDLSGLMKLIGQINPDEIYHLAAMSHVKVSFEIPIYTAQVNAIGTLNILECIRVLNHKKIKFYNASTSELFGKVLEIPQNENTPFYPRSPYAVSKLYAHWITINYREAYNIFACNGILFNHESKTRGETFITRKITRGISLLAYGLKDFLILGNIDSKRDWGHAEDYVKCMHKILNYKSPEDWVIGTGLVYSVREFLVLTFKYIGIEIKFSGEGLLEKATVLSNHGPYKEISVGQIVVKISEDYFRPTEVDYLQANYKKANTLLKWEPTNSLNDIIKEMVDSDLQEAKKKKFLIEKGFKINNEIE